MIKVNRIRKKTIKQYVYNLYEEVVENTPNEKEVVNGVTHQDSDFPSNKSELKTKGLAVGNWKVTSRKDGKYSKSANKRRYNSVDELPIEGNEKEIYIVNNLPYINMLEYGGYFKDSGDWTDLKNSSKHGGKNFNPSDTTNTSNHYSRQAPNGMIRKTVTDNAKQFRRAIKVVKTPND